MSEPRFFSGRSVEEKHVGHASTHVRRPQPLSRDFFAEPQYPDVDLDELRVTLPESDDYYVDDRNPFMIMDDLGPKWLEQSGEAGAPVNEMQLVHMAQYRSRVNLNDADLKNLRGFARDIITKPTYDKGILAIWRDKNSSFKKRNDIPRVVYNPDGTTKVVRPGVGAQTLMVARLMAHIESDRMNSVEVAELPSETHQGFIDLRAEVAAIQGLSPAVMTIEAPYRLDQLDAEGEQ